MQMTKMEACLESGWIAEWNSRICAKEKLLRNGSRITPAFSRRSFRERTHFRLAKADIDFESRLRSFLKRPVFGFALASTKRLFQFQYLFSQVFDFLGLSF